MQRRAVRGAVHIDHGERAALDAHCVDHQHVAFVMADRIPIPGRRDLSRMSFVHAHVPQFRALAVDHQDVVRPLQDLQQEVPKHIRDAAGPALVARRRITLAGRGNLAVLLHDIGCPRPQDRIGVIADQLIEVGDAIGPTRPISHRPRPRCRRLKAGQIGMRPYAREIRYRGGASRTAAGCPGCRRHRLCPGRCRNYCEQCQPQKEMSPLQTSLPLMHSVEAGGDVAK